MAEEIRNPKIEFESMVATYLESHPFKSGSKNTEMEVRFGSNPRTGKPISKIDYDNVVQTLYAAGFHCDNTLGTYYLRINNETVDERNGITKMSNVRAEITGSDLIREYCATNSIQRILDLPSTSSALFEKLKFTQKTPFLGSTDKKPIRMVDFDDFNFRVDLKHEQDFSVHSQVARNIISKWTDSKKKFRHMNRVQFRHPDLPVFADISIIRSSHTIKSVPIPEYTIQEAGVFTNPVKYEIELELNNEMIKANIDKYTAEKLLSDIRHAIRIILTALQGSPYPISNKEQSSVAMAYMRLVHGETYESRKNGLVYSSDFVGPSSVTLQIENIMENTTSTEPNIRSGYTITEKADGERKLLFISADCRIYLIDTNMRIQFTGMTTPQKAFANSLLDGEHIKHDKHGKSIQLYAAFDIYYIDKKSKRDYPFAKVDDVSSDNKYRLVLLNTFIGMLNPQPISGTGACPMRIQCKEFQVATDTFSVFDGCKKIMANINDGIFEYNTDGLIFTPIALGVGARHVGEPEGELPKNKRTWVHSFKWKPPQFNTVDFLVRAKHDLNGRPEIHAFAQSGVQLAADQNIVQYKTYELFCGFDRIKDGFINPFQDILDGKLVDHAGPDEKTYKPMRFIPTQPYDDNAGFCNVALRMDGSGKLVAHTEEGEYFDDNMIVEFRYDMERDGLFRWVPLRVRYDKTAELLAGGANYGNAYKTANSNWRSIHLPITEEMITSGTDIPEIVDDNDVYYNDKGGETTTQGLRDFHNKFVKRALILAVSNKGNSLIDFAVGRGGDLAKWKDAQLGMVFGVDVSKANIQNRKTGACARYLDMCRTNRNMPAALFLEGNSALNLRDGAAFKTDKEKMVARAVFGNGPKDRGVLGEGVYRQYGVGQNGFNVASVQFALHYFFENEIALHGFLRNVAECTKVGGYFVGTCYDGKTVFEMLRGKLRGESVALYTDDSKRAKMFEITRQYDETGLPEDEQSLGYGIDVWQESINKPFREYLVNFDFLVRMMENYGFTLVQKDEAKKLGLPDGTGMFKDLFRQMTDEIKREPHRANNYRMASKMTELEKRISFLNRYFVFRKVAQVANLAKLTKYLQDHASETVDADVEESEFGMGKTRVGKLGQREQPTAAAFIRKINTDHFVIGKYVPIGSDILTAKTSTEPRVETAPDQEVIETLRVQGPTGVQLQGVSTQPIMQKIRVKKPKITIL